MLINLNVLQVLYQEVKGFQDKQHKDDKILFEAPTGPAPKQCFLTTIQFFSGKTDHSETIFANSLKDKPELLGYWVLKEVSSSKFLTCLM